MTVKHIVRRTNPKSRWPFRIVRVRQQVQASGVIRETTHKVAVKFETVEQAHVFIAKNAERIETFC